MARAFDGGAGSFLNFGPVDVDAPNFPSTFTYEAKFRDVSNIDVLMAIYEGTNALVVNQLRTTGTGALLWQQSYTFGGVKSVQTIDGVLTSGAWTNIVLETSGSVIATDRIFVNGVEPSYALQQNASGVTVPEGGDWLFGGRFDNSRNLRGELAELYYRGHPIQPREIAGLAAGASPLFFIRDPDLALGIFKSPSRFYAPLWGYSPERSLVYRATATVPSGVTLSKHPPIIYPRRKHVGGGSPGIVEGTCVDHLTDTDIIAGMWGAGDPQVINQVICSYNWDRLVGDYTKHVIYSAGAATEPGTSIAKFGRRPPLVIKSKGIHDGIGGRAPLDIFDERVARILARFADPPPTLRLDVFYRKHVWQIGDLICITSRLIPNLVAGERGLDDQLFELVSLRYEFAPQGKLVCSFLDVESITPVPEQSIHRHVVEDNAQLAILMGDSSVRSGSLGPAGGFSTLMAPWSSVSPRGGWPSGAWLGVGGGITSHQPADMP